MNLDKTEQLLEKHFNSINKIILSRQDPITGLLPASTAVNAHGDYTDAWVRDNVYSILSVWGLSQAYAKVDVKHYRTYLLSQSVVKLMRALLMAMMRQAHKVEKFKSTHNPYDALHAKYGTKTGLEVVGDYDWGHLQLDATSLFLLMIAQMSASGLRIVSTIDEVNFVQNLVHYISRTYCTADFGIWERGHKINDGATEVNCSSVGMAKAALEVMDGFNLFGDTTSQEAIIHVIPSDIARSRFTLHGLLPRESISKETDGALLSIIGYPAYAIESKEIVEATRAKIVKKLAGNYGCKRFLLDGHQSSIEDHSRIHYEPFELHQFEHIESEWPLFFTYLLLDALMREDFEAVELWKHKLQPLFVEQDEEQLLPELYIVPKECIEAEKQHPKTQKRYPNENIPLVWAQSLYMLSDMILDGILSPSDIDPLNRRKRIGFKCTTKPFVCVLAQNEFVQKQLADLGFATQNAQSFDVVKIMHASKLAQLHTVLGKNDKLGLTGRPLLVPRTITTAKLYALTGQKVIFLPYYFNPKGFYFSKDNELLVEQFRSSLKFLATNWEYEAQPILPFLVREDMLEDTQKNVVINLLKELNTGVVDSISIQKRTMADVLSNVAIERIDNLHGFVLDESGFESEEISNEGEKWCCDWRNLRINAQEQGLYDDRLEDALLDIITAQKRLAVGRAYSEKATFTKPLDSSNIVQIIHEFSGNNAAEDVLTQEIVLHLGHLIRVEPELFANMITLRTWYFVQLLVGYISRKQNLSIADAYEFLLTLPPHEIYNRLRKILLAFSIEVKEMINQENLHASGTQNLGMAVIQEQKSIVQEVDDYSKWREQTGMMFRLSPDFYKGVWYLLQQCRGLVIGDKYNIKSRLGSEITLDTTPGERSFDLLFDSLLHNIEAPDYRQLNIEALESLSILFKNNPEMNLEDDLVMDVLIGHAVKIGWNKNHDLNNYDEQRGLAWEAMYKRSLKETQELFFEAFIYLLSSQGEAA